MVFVLTEHGHVLPGVEVPVAPVGPVAVQRCILFMIVCWLRPKRVNHSYMTSVKRKHNHFKTKMFLMSPMYKDCQEPFVFNPLVYKQYTNT